VEKAMKRLVAGALITAAALLPTMSPAAAHGERGQGWGHGHHDREHGYRHHDREREHGYRHRHAGPPVVIAPRPRVIYAPPVVVAPRPIYIAPRPIYVPPPRVGFGFRIAPNAHGYVTAPVAPGYIYVPPGRVVYGW
jgi:hypothetical protein